MLLTSDYHMLRANGIFKRVGLEVLPRPYPEVEELKIDCQVGHPAKVRAAEPRKQKHDRRDADSLLKLLAEDRFRRSGCLRRSCGIYAPCSGTVISGFASGREYRMPCKPSRSVMV